MAREKVTEKGKRGKKKVWIVLLIAAVLAALVLLLISCGNSGSQAEPEESPEAEIAEPEATEVPKVIVEPETETATPTPGSSAEPAETGSKERDDGRGESRNGDAASNTGSNENGADENREEPPAEEKHEHHWQPVYVTIHHEEKSHVETVIVTPAWDEEVMQWETVCAVCGMRGADVPDHILWDHDGVGHYYSEQVPTGEVIHHDAVTEQRVVIDSPAYDEEVIDHYTCTCGQRKPA